ncbi:MAG: XdhC family protein [Oscillospiraceae bacterium]|nr:XdhC family protein [Oscillospiraceae bacterium]
MRNMLGLMSQKLKEGEELVLVTVIASSGATPRGAGARMLISSEGRLCGTIGGGAVEYRSEAIAKKVLEDKTSLGHDFELTKDDVQNLGMICGGAVSVFFRYIPAKDSEALALAEEAERRFALGRDLWLIFEISEGGRLGLYSEEEGFFGIEAPAELKTSMTRHPIRTVLEGRDFYLEQINSSGRVFIFGCGHVAQELEPVLTHLGFTCVVTDDRPEFASRELFPTASEVKLIDFENIADSVEIGSEDYVCVMTRGHAFDSVVQAQVLRTQACYIGVIGSRHKTAGVQKALREQGFTDKDFERVTTPIGLEIAAETPAEIAISIAAQMIEVRAKRSKA